MEFYDESFDESEPEILENYEEDTYQQFTEEDYDYDDFLMKNGPVFSPYSFDEILENCIIPTATDALKELLPVVFWCIVFRILTQSCKYFIWFKGVLQPLTFVSAVKEKKKRFS